MFALAPLLWGAGIGALGSLLTGNDPIKGAALGGATGGLLGGLPAGSWAGGAAEAAKTSVPNIAASTSGSIASSAAPLSAESIGAGFGYGSVNPVAGFLPEQMAGNYMAASTAVPTAAQSFNPYTGMYDDVLNAGESYIDQGLIGNTNFIPVKNIGATAEQTPYFGGNEIINNVGIPEESLWDKVSPYANVQNLSGATSVYNAFNKPTQYPQAHGGNVQRGQAPQGTDVMELIKAIKQPERRRISLI